MVTWVFPKSSSKSSMNHIYAFISPIKSVPASIYNIITYFINFLLCSLSEAKGMLSLETSLSVALQETHFLE